MRTRPVRVVADDGYRLGATLFETAGGNNEVCVLVNGAAGVPQDYYAGYARFLAEQGFSVLTYDYRGVGASRMSHWLGAAPALPDWGARDLPAAIDWLTRERAGYGLAVLGHAFGGQALGQAWNNYLIRGLLGISTTLACHTLWPYHLRPLVWLLRRLPLSLAVRLLQRPLAANSELSLAATADWMRWCRNQDFSRREGDPVLGDQFGSYRGRLRLYCIGDDALHAPLQAVAALGRAYANAGVELVKVRPRDWGVPAIGHFGFFRSDTPRAAWQECADWLLNAGRIPKPKLIEV